MYKAECRFCQFVAHGGSQESAFKALGVHVEDEHPGKNVPAETPRTRTATVTPLHKEQSAR